MGLSACKSSIKTQYWGSRNITKKQMRQKLVYDFSAEQKENVKDEVKRELDMQYKAHISSLSDDLIIGKQKHEKTKKELVQANKLNDSLREMNIMLVGFKREIRIKNMGLKDKATNYLRMLSKRLI